MALVLIFPSDELLFVMGGTLRSRPDSVSLIKGSVGLAALSFTTDEEAPIDYCLLYDGPHPSEASPTHLLCLTSRGQVIVEAFVHDPKGYVLSSSWLFFFFFHFFHKDNINSPCSRPLHRGFNSTPQQV